MAFLLEPPAALCEPADDAYTVVRGTARLQVRVIQVFPAPCIPVPLSTSNGLE